MQELRSWMLGVSVTVILTGIIAKLVPGKTNKSIICFITTMVIIVTIFDLNVNELSNILEIELTTNLYTENDLSNELYNDIAETLSGSIKNSVKEIVIFYASDASVEVEFDNEVTYIKIDAHDLSQTDMTEIEKEVKKIFDGEINFVYGGEVND